MSKRLFCFGLGFTARVLADRLAGQGWQIAGTTRDPAKAESLRRHGFDMHLFGRDHPLDDPQRALAGTTHVLHSIIPDLEGDPVADRHLEDLRALGGLEWLGWLGTTAVYGDRQGEWVDEDAVLTPGADRAQRRLAAERTWLASGLPAHLFRLAGIYGPGRNQVRDVLDGHARRIVKPGQVFSRIHVEDIATVLEASIARPRPGAVYNVCDDEPAPPQDVVAFAAELLGVEPPPALDYATATLSPMARSFYADNRRVRNDRIKAELGVRLAFPSYREGLRALLPVETAQLNGRPST
nr:SDR family oxidoreductase [Geminicoccus roseus]